jgi:hypothetical protein
MAFLRYARANVVTPQVRAPQWDKLRVASGSKEVSRSLKAKAEDILGEEFTPDRYLLTHATIVCSVDAVTPPNTKTGSIKEGGFTINRKYPDYRISKETDKYINNNLDSWSRGVIKKSYQTFIGAHNFVEHVQVEELSKGRIIDAVLRDIGESLYVDILVATDRKHKDLVEQILSGEMNSMSMGCFVPDTQVTLGDGTRVAISEVHVGDHVITHTGESKVIKNIMTYRNGDSWRMRTISALGIDPVTSTANHPFLVVRPVKECACGCGEDLEANNKDPQRNLDVRFKQGHDKRVYNPNNSYSEEESKERLQKMDKIKELNVVEIPASEIVVGDYLITPRVKDTNSTATDRAKARLLGYFLAEGSFLKHNGDVVGVEFSFSFEELQTYASEVKDLLSEAFPQENPARVYAREEKGSSRVQISSRVVAEWFLTHGGEYSNSKKLSLEVMNWSTESQLEMIGAWINGDGHLHKIHQHTSACTISYDLACQMDILLAKCGLASRMEVKESDGYRQTAYCLIIGKIEAQTLNPYCDKVASASSHKNSLRLTEDYVLRKVTATAESFYDGEVYDLEIEDDHTYLVEGVAVHNCSVDFTLCTKCGHVAADETEMCSHVKYEKGNTFFDDQGNKHRVAELCGHEETGETGGVTFIEASWVATPAFPGAVARNTLDIPEKWVAKTASIVKAAFGDEEETEEKPEPTNEGLLKKLDSVYEEAVVDRFRKKLQSEIKKEKAQEVLDPPISKSTVEQNDTIIKEGGVDTEDYMKAVGLSVKTASTIQEAVFNLALVNNHYGVSIPSRVYKVASILGKPSKYSSAKEFLERAAHVNGRTLTEKESFALIRISKLLSLNNFGQK